MSSWWGLRLGRRRSLEDCAKKNEREIKSTSENSKISSGNSDDSSDSGRELEEEFSGFPLIGASDDRACVEGVIWFSSRSGSNWSVGSSGSPDNHAHVAFRIRKQGEKGGSGTITVSQDQVLKGNKSAHQGHRLPLPPGPPPSRHIPRSPRTPETLSKWRKGKFIRKCSSGLLYLGFNSDGGQMCMIKEVTASSDDISSRNCLNKLNQEKTLLSQLSHMNIVQYYGFDMTGTKLSIYLECISGYSVLQLLEEYGPLGEPIIQSYIQQLLSALVYLHTRDTVHRDIRGENIVVTHNGNVKLVDFGMAKPLTSCSSSSTPFKGCPYWMAPEVVMNTNAYNLAADIWSLGCTVIEMATSKPPWSQYEGACAIGEIAKTGDVPGLPDHLSSDAKSFIKLCLQREPSARPTARQLLNHPFVRKQTSLNLRSANTTKAKESVPHTLAPKRKPKILESCSGSSERTPPISLESCLDRPGLSRFPMPQPIIIPRESLFLPVNDADRPKKTNLSAPYSFFPVSGQNNRKEEIPASLNSRTGKIDPRLLDRTPVPSPASTHPGKHF